MEPWAKNVGIALLVVAALMSVWFMMAVMHRKPSGFVDHKPVVNYADRNREIAADKASQALKKQAWDEVLKLLEPYKDQADARVQALLGSARFGRKDYVAAVPALTQALSLSKDKEKDPELRLKLGQAHEALGQATAAREIFVELRKIKAPGPLKIPILLGFARAAVGTGDLTGAEEAYGRLVVDDARLEEPFVELFKIAASRKQATALAAWKSAGDPWHEERFPYNFWLGNLHRALGELEPAIGYYERCIKIDPTSPLPPYALWEIRKQQGDMGRALEHLGQVFDLDLTLPAPINQTELYFDAALAARKVDRYDLAFKFLRGSLLFDRTLLGRNDEGVIAAVEKFIKARGGAEEQLFMGIFTVFYNGEYRKAREEMKAALGSLKNARLAADGRRMILECDEVIAQEEAYQEYMAMLEAQKKAQEDERRKALEQLKSRRDALARGNKPPKPARGAPDPRCAQIRDHALGNPKDPQIQYESGVQLMQLGDFRGAKQLIGNAIALNPQYREAYTTLGEILQQECEFAEAIKNFQIALSLDPKDSRGYSRVARLFLVSDNVPEAIDNANEALGLDPNNAEARLVMAGVYYRSKRPKDALEEINRGLQAENDSSSEISQALEALRRQVRENF